MLSRIKKKVKIFAAVIAMLTLVFIGSLIVCSLHQRIIPGDLEDLLITDTSDHTEVGTSTIYVPNLIDKYVGDYPYLFQVKRIQYIDGSDIDSPNLEACLKIRMTYRDPGRFSVFSFGSPTEEFLYHVQKENEVWTIEYLRKSEINQTLSDSSCIEKD